MHAAGLFCARPEVHTELAAGAWLFHALDRASNCLYCFDHRRYYEVECVGPFTLSELLYEQHSYDFLRRVLPVLREHGVLHLSWMRLSGFESD
jgi:hypothetical protein